MSDLARPPKQLTVGTPEEVIQEKVSESFLYEHVVQGFQFLGDHFDLGTDVSVATMLTYALEEKGFTPDEVSGLFVKFTQSPELRDCLKYSRSPTPRDFLEVAHRHADRPIIDE
jgi:hypothetical protein